MKKEVTATLNLIKDLELENDVRMALNVSEKRYSSPQKTSNGYEIYYEESSGEAVGIVYNNIVFLKKSSGRLMTLFEADWYCKSIVINGVTSQLCPVDDSWIGELKKIYRDLYQALTEIGAENLDHYTWCSKHPNANYAWIQRLSNGDTSYYGKSNFRYVRPVLVLKC